MLPEQVPCSLNRYDQKVRAPVSKSQGSVSGTKSYPLSLSVVRTIRLSVSQEMKDSLGAVNLVTGCGIVLMDKVKEVVMVEFSLQLNKHQQVIQLNKVTHLVQVAVSTRTGCMLFRLARIKKVLLM